jgi:hypothetical protein
MSDERLAAIDAEIAAWQKLPDTKSKSRSRHIRRLQRLRQSLAEEIAAELRASNK